MNIIFNGEPRTVSDGCTVDQLLHELELANKRVAVEINGDIVPRSQHGIREFADRDRVEVVVAVGGG